LNDTNGVRKVLRMSNAITNSNYPSQVFSDTSALIAGESGAALWNNRGTNGSAPINPVQFGSYSGSNIFYSKISFRSATGAPQPGLNLTLSPSAKQSAVRMSWLQLADNGSTGFNINFIEALGSTGVGNASFSPTTTVASGLSYTDLHTVEMVITFVDGVNNTGGTITGNDVVEIFVNGNLVHTGTTWESYYYNNERITTGVPRLQAVNSMLIRAAGTAATATSGNGFFFEDFAIGNSVPQACSLTATVTITQLPQPAQPSGLACYESASFNNTTCQWDVTGTQPSQPSGLACYESASFNNTTCQWDVTGTQPFAPTGLAFWQTATFNTTTCQWDITGTPPGAPVAGTVVYANAASMPMVNAVVVLKQGNTEVHRDTTDATGAFYLSAVVAGSYDVVVTPNTAWGGVNATDAIMIINHFTNRVLLNGIKLIAADVNGSQALNATDALNTLQRFTGAIPSFSVGNYAAGTASYTASGTGTGTLNVSMLCYGDVNGSYQPTGGFVRTTWRSLDQQGVLRVGATGSYEVPLYASRQVQPGAVSLELALPEGVRLLGVRASEALDAQQVVYHQQGNRVRIAWIDESGAELRTGEALAYLMVEGDARGVWRWSSEVELANVLGEVQAGVELRMPKLTQGFEALAVSIYPNPGQGMRTLEMSLGESMRVVVRVTDALGRVVYAREGLHYGTGTHKLELNMEGRPAGSYQVQVLGETTDEKYEQRNLTILQTR
jgi:hypothetical protein